MNQPWPNLRHKSLHQRRAWLEQHVGPANDGNLLDLADRMIEQAIGVMAIPLGLATGFVVDGQSLAVPLATEEPSVVAAASFAATKIGRHGGFLTKTDPSLMEAQIFLNFDRPADQTVGQAVLAAEADLRRHLAPMLAGMTARGGGWRSLAVTALPMNNLKVTVTIDVCDAMGANLVNSCAELLRQPLAQLTGGQVLMAILSNAANRRLSRAQFCLPVADCARNGLDGLTAARRIVAANNLANHDPSRAVTHNKGIMNGITALALATGNDTRAVEAGAHAFASQSGQYGALTNYYLDDSQTNLCGQIELPIALGVVGGATAVHPTACWARAILGRPSARQLAGIAAAVGLAQNFAALAALTAEGIQAGHLPLQTRRLQNQQG